MSKKIEQKFQSKWNDWRRLLAQLVEKSGGGARLICPEGRELAIDYPDDGNVIKVTLPYPICFYAVPQKLKREGNRTSSNSLAIFIDGNFWLDPSDQSNLKDIDSSAAFFQISHSNTDNTKLLELMDAYHFDFFTEEVTGASPHPVFHAQRNIRLNDSLPRFKQALEKDTACRRVEISEPSQADKNTLFRLGSFRIPTPQMDVLNLGAAIAANQLVSSDNQTQWDVFNRLLSGIHGEDNAQHLTVQPRGHNTKMFALPRKHLPDWYSTRT